MTEEYKRQLLAKAAAKTLSPSEQQEIELAMQQDAFLKEAYLGYRESEQQDVNVSDLRKKLALKVSGEVKQPVLWPYLAAALVLLLGGIFLWNTAGFDHSPSTIGLVVTKADQKAVASDLNLDADVSEQNQTIVAADQQISQNGQDVIPEIDAKNEKLQTSSGEEKPITKPVAPPPAQSPVPEEEQAENEAESQQGDLAAASTLNVTDEIEVKWRILDENFEPLPGVAIRLMSNEKLGQSNGKGEFSHRIKRSQQFLRIEHQNYEIYGSVTFWQ